MGLIQGDAETGGAGSNPEDVPGVDDLGGIERGEDLDSSRRGDGEQPNGRNGPPVGGRLIKGERDTEVLLARGRGREGGGVVGDRLAGVSSPGAFGASARLAGCGGVEREIPSGGVAVSRGPEHMVQDGVFKFVGKSSHKKKGFRVFE